MRSIFVLLILVMIGLNGKGQSVTALPDSVLSQCCLEVTLLNGNVTTVDWVFVQYITRDGTGTKLFVEYAPNFGGIQWETQIRIQDDFDEVLERSKFIVIPFTVGSTDYGINRNWIANIEENTTTGGTWIYGRFGTPTKRKFSAVEDYETMKNRLLACRPRAIVVAENGLYTEGDTVRMGGILIEDTRIETGTFDFEMIDTLTSMAFGIDHNGVYGDTTFYAGRRWGSFRNLMSIGRDYWFHEAIDTVSGDKTHILSGLDAFGLPSFDVVTSNGSGTKRAQFQQYRDSGFWTMKDSDTNPNYTQSFFISPTSVGLGNSESSGGEPGNGVSVIAYGSGSADEFIGITTRGVDNSTATVGQFLQLQDVLTGEVEFATIDLSAYLPIADTAAMLDPYIQGAGTINRVPIFTGSRVIGNSNIQDNGTAVSILSSKPFQLGQWTTAGRPSGVTGYDGFNTSFGEHEYYSVSDWYFRSPWKQSTSSSNVFFNSGSAIVNSSSVLNSNYKLQVNGGALYSGATFTTNLTNQAALDIRGINLTAQSGTAHQVWGINIEGAMTFNTINQVYGGLRIATTSNATANQVVRPFDISVSAAVLAGGRLINTNATGGADFMVAGGSASVPERIVMRSPNGGTGGSALPGYNYLSTAGNFGWAITGNNSGLSINSYVAGINPNSVDPTFHLRDNKVLIGRRISATPTATLEVTGEGTGNSTTAFLVQNSGRANSAFRIRDDASARFGGKMMVGTDTSFVHNPATDTTFIKGSARIRDGDLRIENTTTTPYLIIEAKGGGNKEANIYLKSSGSFSPAIEIDAAAGSAGSAKSLNIINYNTDAGVKRVFNFGGELGQFGGRSIGRFSVYDSLEANRKFSFFSNGIAVFDTYGTPATTAAALSKTESGYVASFATDGTVLSRALADIQDGNGIYTGSDSLASTNTRALIGQNSKLSFSQVYNSGADSARITITNSNSSDGFRAIELELLDTVHAGGKAKLTLAKGSDNDIMSLSGEVEDQDGITTFTATGNGFGIASNSFTATTDFATFAGSEVKMSAYGDGDMTAANLGFSNPTYISAFAPSGSGQGTILDLKLGTGLAISGGELVATGATVELKRDTTIYVTDVDYDFSAAITTAQILARYNRIIIFMTCSSSASDHNTLTMHTPDANLAQCEIVVYSIDDNGTYRNDITFGASNLLSPTGSLNTTYNLSAGQWLHVRVADRSGYKYFISY